MPLPRFLKLDPTQQARLLDAATSEFAQGGFELASLNRVIDAAGVSKGAFYYYFADKADLYGTVVDRAVEHMLDAVGPLAEFHDPEAFWAACATYIEQTTMFALGAPALASLAKHVYRNEAGVLDTLAARASTALEGVLREGQQVGAVRADVPLDLLTQAAMGLLMAMDRWFADHFDSLPPEQLAALAPRALDLCRDLLSPKPTSRGTPQS